uniref:Putative secreted protein n=1 Tax=Anopheles marajoara TaxID=58244 RepID=A0A2M4CBG1_9DIPT
MRCSERVCLWSVCVCVCVCTHPCPQPRKKVETFYKYTLELGFVCKRLGYGLSARQVRPGRCRRGMCRDIDRTIAPSIHPSIE